MGVCSLANCEKKSSVNAFLSYEKEFPLIESAQSKYRGYKE